jgi:hypothetical protein
MAFTGARDGCPICRTALSATPAEPIANRRCPRCEACLWAIAASSGSVFFVRRPGQSAAEFLATLAGSGLAASEQDIASFLEEADFLDLVEFLYELSL